MMIYNFNDSIIFFEKILNSIDNHALHKDKYYFNNQKYKELAQNIINDDFNLSDEDTIKDEVFSELFKTFYETNKENCFDKIINIFLKYKRTYFTIYFYNNEQKKYFLSQVASYLIDNLVKIDNFNSHLTKIDKDLEVIFKEHKQNMWNGTLPDNIPKSFKNQIDMYSFFETYMNLEHLNRDTYIIRDSLLYIILENEEKKIYYYSSEKTFKLIQSILDNAIEINDIFMINKILHTHDIKLNCFLLTQAKYCHFAFINLIKRFYINNSTMTYELKVYKTMLEILINVYFEQYKKDYDSNKNDKLYFLLSFIINWKNELQEPLLDLLDIKLQIIDIENIIEMSLEKKDISLIYFLFTVSEKMQTIDSGTLEKLSLFVVESFIKSYDKPFNRYDYKEFNFKSLFKYTSINRLVTFCKELDNIKDDSNKYRFSDYFEVLFNLYTKEIESDIVNIVLNFAKTDWGLNLGLVSQNEFISLLNLFDLDNFKKVLKEITNVDDLLQIYNILLDKVKRNIVSKKLDNVEISVVSKDSAFLAQQLGFEKLSNKILSMLKDDETSNFVRIKTELLNIYTSNSLSKDEKFEKFNNFNFDSIHHFNKQYCLFYKSFLHTILNFEKNPKHVYDSLQILFEKSPQHLYLINIASAYIEFVKYDDSRVEKLQYFIEEFNQYLAKLDNTITEEYEILLYLYNETDNYIEFEKLWKSMQRVDTLSLNIVKLRVNFLIKKLQSTEAIKFLDDIESYYFDADTIQEIKNLRLEIKNGAKAKLETIGMRFEEITKENSMYDVALSFAGEQREYVEEVAKALKEKKIDVFYDDYEKHNLWGKDLYEHLDEVYSAKSKFVIMFISKEYAEKLWTTHERKSAQERAFKEKEEYILPVRFDDTKIPGIRATIGYIDANQLTPSALVKEFIKKFYGE